jgi:hypothetical protein
LIKEALPPIDESASTDELLQLLADWLDASNSDITWPFVKRGLIHLIADLKLGSVEGIDRTKIEEDIAKIEGFIEHQGQQRA